jgi:hypothetical protein
VGRTVCALALVAALVPTAAWSQQDSAAARHAPPSPIDGYAITESKAFPDASQGTVFRYTKAGQPSIDVFVYPYAAPAAPLTAAMGEANTFQASLPVLQQKGYFESYKVAFSTTDTTRVGTGVVLGSLVGGAQAARPDRSVVSICLRVARRHAEGACRRASGAAGAFRCSSIRARSRRTHGGGHPGLARPERVFEHLAPSHHEYGEPRPAARELATPDHCLSMTN